MIFFYFCPLSFVLCLLYLYSYFVFAPPPPHHHHPPRCKRPQRDIFSDGSETEALSDLCPCACKAKKEEETPEEASCFQDMIEYQVLVC